MNFPPFLSKIPFFLKVSQMQEVQALLSASRLLPLLGGIQELSPASLRFCLTRRLLDNEILNHFFCCFRFSATN